MFNLKKTAISLGAIVLSASIFAFSASAALAYGDCNRDGDVDVRDVIRIKKYLATEITVDEISVSAADYDNDELVQPTDMAHLRKVLLGAADYDGTVPYGEAEWNDNWNN